MLRRCVVCVVCIGCMPLDVCGPSNLFVCVCVCVCGVCVHVCVVCNALCISIVVDLASS